MQQQQDKHEQQQKEELYRLVLLGCYVYCLLVLGLKLYLNVVLLYGVFGVDFIGNVPYIFGFLFLVFRVLSFRVRKSCTGL